MPKRKVRRRGRSVLPIFVVLLAAAVALTVFLAVSPFGPSQEVFVEIPPHTGTAGIAESLKRDGVIRSAWAFAVLHEVEGGSLKAGEYRFDHALSMVEVYRKIRRGEVYTVALVIPEGYNLFDIAGAVQRAGLGQADVFLAAAKAHASLAHPWSPEADSLEGYLFPDTYRFSRHTTPLQMLQAMTRRFGQVALRIGLAGPEVPRVVTMASLVEREVHEDAERPLVAGVFEHRLRLGMPLQTDPAVVYASQLRDTWTGVIHRSELQSDSPYNTYTHRGLPPGPICNPGVAALRAAMHPQTTDFLYFVANPDGTTRFARTLEEHNSNVVAYRGAQNRGQ